MAFVLKSTVERHLTGINFVTFVKNFVAFVLKYFNTKFTEINAKSMT